MKKEKWNTAKQRDIFPLVKFRLFLYVHLLSFLPTFPQTWKYISVGISHMIEVEKMLIMLAWDWSLYGSTQLFFCFLQQKTDAIIKESACWGEWRGRRVEEGRILNSLKRKDNRNSVFSFHPQLLKMNLTLPWVNKHQLS